MALAATGDDAFIVLYFVVALAYIGLRKRSWQLPQVRRYDA
eukprot:SAG11_NODE_9855_length_875_cov_1.128866_1_plen_40_part_10